MIWSPFISMRDLLEKILEAKDDISMEEDEVMSKQREQMQETHIEKRRRETFDQIARLAFQRTAKEAEIFFDDLDWIACPADIQKQIRDYFGRPGFNYDAASTQPGSIASADLVKNMKQIVELINYLRKVDRHGDLLWQTKVLGEKYERELRRRETPIQTLRRHAFARAAELTGRPAKNFEQIYDRIDWSPTTIHMQRFKELRRFIYETMPEFDGRDRPEDHEDWRRWRDQNKAAVKAQQWAEHIYPGIERLFAELRYDIRAEQAKQSAA